MYYPKMLGLCIKITKEDEDTAKDLVHDAFVLALSSLHHLHTPERFGEWLSAIVRNVALKYMEKKGKINFTSITDEDEKIVDTNASSDSMANQEDILQLISKLPSGYGKIFQLYVINGFSHQEIADMLGIEAHSSSSQLSRAKAMLRKMMNRRLLTVVLLLAMAIPFYFFMLREKPLRPQRPKIAKDDRRRKGVNTNRKPKNIEDKIEVCKPTSKKQFAFVINDEKQDTVQISDTTFVATFTSDGNATEHKQDSTEKDSIIQPFTLPHNEITTKETKQKSNKWQMLAAGSLGPALTQDIYKMFATDNIDSSVNPDLPLPSLPDNISNWEDYSKYLHAIGHDKMSKDTLALIEIADHNQGEIVEKEQHDRPITFGISLSMPLSERWSIETGLQYSILKSRSTMGNDEYYINKKQKIHYLGIPIRLSYNFADYKRLSAYSSAGLSLNIPIYGKVDSNYVVGNTPTHIDSWHITPPAQWSINFSLGLQYHILPKVTLYVEPTLYWQIPNSSNTHTIWTEHPIMFSAPFGIRIAW